MYRVLDCIRYEHDYRLVLVAIAICAVTTWTAWYLYAMSSRSHGLSRSAWILQTAVAAGSGIWATHFIAMLAFRSALPTTYDSLLTLASLLIAIFVTGAGFCIADSSLSKWTSIAAGSVIGTGIAMPCAAQRTPGADWSRKALFCSIASARLFTVLAKNREGSSASLVSASLP